MPDLYIISGSNGAGKSTIGQDYVPANVLEDSSIFDGDKLYMHKHLELWKSGMRADKRIKEIANDFVLETFSQLIDEAIGSRKHFAYEGHFTEDGSWNVPRLFKNEGYAIHLIFFGLSNTDQSDEMFCVKAGLHHFQCPIFPDFYGSSLQGFICKYFIRRLYFVHGIKCPNII
jgi:predicted ABC-type ATPase